MSKDKKPYYLDMNIDISKIENLKEGMTAAHLCMNILIGAVSSVSEKNKGISMQDHHRLYSLRNSLEAAIALGETEKVEIEHDVFKFVMRYWELQTPSSNYNELIMQVEAKLKKSMKDYLAVD